MGKKVTPQSLLLCWESEADAPTVSSFLSLLQSNQCMHSFKKLTLFRKIVAALVRRQRLVDNPSAHQQESRQWDWNITHQSKWLDNSNSLDDLSNIINEGVIPGRWHSLLFFLFSICWCGAFFKVFVEFVTLFLFYTLIFWPQGMWES